MGCRASAGIFAVALVCVTAALAAPGDPKKQLTAAGQTYARSIALRPGELPGTGWKRTPTDFSNPNPPCFVKHYNLSGLTVNGQAGFQYTRGTSDIGSDVHVFVTNAQARRAFSILAKGGLGRCYASYVFASVGIPAKILRVEAVHLDVPRAAADAFRIVFKLGQGARVARIYVIQANLQRGRAIGTLTLARQSRDWPDSTVRSLAAKMASRMTRG